MDANEGVQSFNFEVGQKFKSFKEFESQLKHYQDAKFIQIYRSSCKIESTKSKQTITNNDLVVDLPTKILDENININRIKKKFTIDEWKCLKYKISKTKETAEWNCLICKIDVHLYASIVCDGCLEWNHLNCVGLKAPPKSTYWLCRQCYNKGK
jgi:hypothetical protein